MTSLTADKQNLVIIGGSFAGATFARPAERLLDRLMNVIVMSLEMFLLDWWIKDHAGILQTERTLRAARLTISHFLTYVNRNGHPIERDSPDAQLIMVGWQSTQVHLHFKVS